MIQFEYDINKSRSNLLKHGINFEEAQLLWLDQELLELKPILQTSRDG